MQVLTARYGSSDAPEVFTRSLRETGFGVMVNHPISQKLIADTFKDWELFFASQEKFKHTFKPELQAGYFPYKTENAKNHKLKDLKEFFHYYTWAELPESVRRNTEELYRQMHQLGSDMLNWIEQHTPADIQKALSEPLSSMIKNSRETLLRPIHYPPIEDGESNGAIRAAAHEDINLITLLPAATAPGLQVKGANGQWYDVPCDQGSIVVNVGDMLQMATQGYYKSTTHQVINPHGPQAKLARYSMPLFIHPRPDVVLSNEHTAGSYLQERLKEIGLKK